MLTPCAGCRRHVEDTDAHCPFCGATVVVPRIVPMLEGRLSRAAVLATAVLVAPACVVNDPPPPQYVRQPPPNDPPPYEPPPPPTDYAKPPPDDRPPPPDDRPPPPPPAPVADAVIRGTVTMAGQPQPHVQMVLHGGPTPINFATDAYGVYSVRVPAGQYQLHLGAGGGSQRMVQAESGREAVVNIAFTPYKQRIMAKPYGAPPARRRLV